MPRKTTQRKKVNPQQEAPSQAPKLKPKPKPKQATIASLGPLGGPTPVDAEKVKKQVGRPKGTRNPVPTQQSNAEVQRLLALPHEHIVGFTNKEVSDTLKNLTDDAILQRGDLSDAQKQQLIAERKDRARTLAEANAPLSVTAQSIFDAVDRDEDLMEFEEARIYENNPNAINVLLNLSTKKLFEGLLSKDKFEIIKSFSKKQLEKKGEFEHRKIIGSVIGPKNRKQIKRFVV